MADLQKVYADAQSLANEGQFAKAAEMYQKIIDNRPELAEAHLNQGACYYRAGQLDKALAGFDAAIAIDDTLYNAHYNKAKLLASMNDFEGAIPSFERAYELNQNVAIYEELANACNQANQFEKALDVAGKGLVANKNFSLSLHNARIVAFIKLGKEDEALEDVDAVLKVKSWAELPTEMTKIYAFIISVRGQKLLQAGKFQEALKFFERVNQVDPDEKRLQGQAICLLQLGLLRESIPVFQKALELDKTNWRVAATIGSTLSRLQDFAKGVEYLEMALKSPEAKTDVETNINYALALLNLGRKQEARPHLQYVHDTDPSRWEVSAILGAVMLEDQEYANAVPVLESAIEHAKGKADSSVYYNLGYALLMLNRMEEALENFNKVAQLDPTNDSAKTAIEQLKLAIKEKQEEEKAAKEALEREQAKAIKEKAAQDAEAAKIREAEAAEKARQAAIEAENAAKAQNVAGKQSGPGLTDNYFEPKGPNFKVSHNGTKLGPVGKRIAELQVLLKPSEAPTQYRRKSLEAIPKGIAYNGATSYADWFNKQNKQKGDEVFGQK